VQIGIGQIAIGRSTIGRFALVLSLLTPSTATFAQVAESTTCRVVVLNLNGKNLSEADKDIPSLLTETLANEVNLVSGCRVVTQADVSQMLDFEAQKATCSDGGDSCLSEIGQALGAERVIGGTLGKLGVEFVLTARLMNVRDGVVESRAEQVVPGSAEKLRTAAKNVGRQLFGKELLPSEPAPIPVVVPTTTTTAAASSSFSPLFLAGAGLGIAGLVTAGVGGALAAVAESRLGDPTVTDKDGVTADGQLALGVAVAGVVVGAAGGGMLIASMMME
jgi:hypothetical protein